MLATLEKNQSHSRDRARPAAPALELRLQRLASSLIEHAHSAGLRHFRYCKRISEKPPSLAAYLQRIENLESDLAAAERVCETSVIEWLRDAAALLNAPIALGTVRKAAIRALLADSLDSLR